MKELEELEEYFRQVEPRLTEEDRKHIRNAIGYTREAFIFLETKYLDTIRDRAVVHSLLEKTSKDLFLRYQTIFEYSGTAMLVLELDGTLSLANSYVERLLGYSREEIVNRRKFSEFADAELTKKVQNYLLNAGSGNPDLPQYFEGYMTDFYGKQLVVTVMIGRFPETGQCVLSIIDISDRKHAEEALELAIKKLNLLNSITRHDVINQLTTLNGFIQLAKIKSDSPLTVRSFLDKSLDSVTAITKLIEFTKYYQDIGVMKPDWYNVSREIHSSADQISLGEVAITEELDGLEIYADPLIRKVFYNLMDNALRHGEHVTIISFTCAAERSGFMITYTDNGVGVPDDLKERIFSRGFGQNTGLGLFLIREILSMTGITIRETGVYGSGCRFEIHIPENKGRIRKCSPAAKNDGTVARPAQSS